MGAFLILGIIAAGLVGSFVFINQIKALFGTEQQQTQGNMWLALIILGIVGMVLVFAYFTFFTK